jgi:hypothetical protein
MLWQLPSTLLLSYLPAHAVSVSFKAVVNIQQHGGSRFGFVFGVRL